MSPAELSIAALEPRPAPQGQGAPARLGGFEQLLASLGGGGAPDEAAAPVVQGGARPAGRLSRPMSAAPEAANDGPVQAAALATPTRPGRLIQPQPLTSAAPAAPGEPAAPASGPDPSAETTPLTAALVGSTPQTAPAQAAPPTAAAAASQTSTPASAVAAPVATIADAAPQAPGVAQLSTPQTPGSPPLAAAPAGQAQAQAQPQAQFQTQGATEGLAALSAMALQMQDEGADTAETRPPTAPLTPTSPAAASIQGGAAHPMAAQTAVAAHAQTQAQAQTAARAEASQTAEVPGAAADDALMASLPQSAAATASLTGAAFQPTVHAAHAVAAADVLAQVSAQILRRLEGQVSRFQMELHPADLGQVDVKLDIDAEGRLQARLAFDNPAAAAEMRGRVDELRRDLQQAGFQLADDAFSFAERGDQDSRGGRRAAHAFDAGERLTEAAEAPMQRLTFNARSGVDVRI
ncbi:flagellar hook-length control protein FliK [Brevundimonas sp. 2R-24]|uniref:Flagellar hook-length control protein FliK n=1 Tax=Peiella sedimenti TaxID=3061083 RepID=A0ABT8SND8_9CAUL|nr:flagellar hook-length control protein FliK [Caulobacteraceae bacterium XZ-24]